MRHAARPVPDRSTAPTRTAPGLPSTAGTICVGGLVARMTAPVVVSESGETRTLGWDMNTSFSSNRGDLFPLGSFGHTGFTGTSIWIDPTTQTYIILLTNAVHPRGKGNAIGLRVKVAGRGSDEDFAAKEETQNRLDAVAR